MLPLLRPLPLAFCVLSLVPVVAPGQGRVARIAGSIEGNQLRTLARNTHPLARPEFDAGLAPANLPMDRMLLVLSMSPAQQQDLKQLLADQLDKSSPTYQKWLTPEQFGERFGVAEADLSQVANWLAASGFEVSRVSNAKNVIEFSGNAGQVQAAFHTGIHKYNVNGTAYWANATDPQIPSALSGVVAGVSTLHSFRKASQIAGFQPHMAARASSSASGPRPSLTFSNNLHALAPADFTVIYGNELNTSITATIAVVGRSNINIQDVKDFRSTFSLAENTPQILVNGPDPGDLGGGEEAEAVLDVSWAGVVTPDAAVELVVSKSTNTTDGITLSEQFIVDNNLADIMTESFGGCEASFTAAETQLISALAQQAAAQGITYTVAAGDSGAAGCDDANAVTRASGPIAVNLLAATPWNIAVGGTQMNDVGQDSLYWTDQNAFNGQSVFGFIPQVVWNESCVAGSCGSGSPGIWAGGGGASMVFPKPSWQSGVPGIPADGARDIPDVSLSSAGHDPYLICLEGSCVPTASGEISFAGISGTSAATPSFAGMMAAIVESTSSRQGQAAATLYRMASQLDWGSCSAAIGFAPGSCTFRDIVAGNNAVPGEAGYGSEGADYQAGTGYDLASGLGIPMIESLILSWEGGRISVPRIRGFVDWPANNGNVAGSTLFRGWALADSDVVTSVSVAIDSVPYGLATYGLSRADVCQVYSNNNCPNVGWSFPFDTDFLTNGPHTLAITVATASGPVYTIPSSFTVANWVPTSSVRMSIDSPNSSTGPISGIVNFGGWAFSTTAQMKEIAVSVDGIPAGTAVYGGLRFDACQVNSPNCPFVGWNFSLDTTNLSDGEHLLSVTFRAYDGGQLTKIASFTVANTPNNVLTLSIDQPAAQAGPFSGVANFGGWSTGTSQAVTEVQVTIDGVPSGAAAYGGSRTDVCLPSTRAGCPNVGWNLSLDTTQLLNGQHILGLKALTATGQFASVTRLFAVSNAVSAGPVWIYFDTPSPQNAIFRGSVTVNGWAAAVSSRTPLSNIAVAIDGVPYGTATYGGSRLDVCSVYPSIPNCASSGWAFQLDTTLLADGPHAVTINATSQDGSLAASLSSGFTVANLGGNPMKLSIDTPSSQSGPLSGTTGIGGWAFDTESPLSKVSITVDGAPLGDAQYGSRRSDVCAAFPGAAGCPNIGWNYLLNTTAFSDGSHMLGIVGTTQTGRSSAITGTFTIANGNSSPVRVNIDDPSANQTLAGIASVAGWALATNGAQINEVDILIDGQWNGTATLGGSRADVCAQFPGGGGCPNVGWDYRFDSRVFASGPHTMEVRAKAIDGNQATAGTSFNVINEP